VLDQHALTNFFVKLRETKPEIGRGNVPSLRIASAKHITQSRTDLPCCPAGQQGREAD
jgi:hypothetical protein